MPYLRITCPELGVEKRRMIASRLTDTIVDLFFRSRSPTSRTELRERTTIHFVPHGSDELFIGGRTPTERETTDITVELSDWNMTVRKQRDVARSLTPVLAELFDVPPDERDGINVRFHSYPPSNFAVGGELLSDTVPLVGRVLKLLFG